MPEHEQELSRFFAPDASFPLSVRDEMVISYDLWMRRFGGEPDALGRTVLLSGYPVQIIGIAEEGFGG